MTMSTFDAQRQKMIDRQIMSRGISDRRVLAAMRSVPREYFVGIKLQVYAYDDRPLPIEEHQTISQPYIVALMAESLNLTSGDRVLEIGTGSGYAAAVLSRIACKVYGVERHARLAHLAEQRLTDLGYENVRIRCADGTSGWEEHAPFDAIMVSACGQEIPKPLLQQLKTGGRLVIPIGQDSRSQELLRILKVDELTFQQATLSRVQFVPLVSGEASNPN